MHAPRVEHVDVVGDLHDEGHVVLHDDHRDPGPCDPPQQPPEVRGVLVPKPRRGLVEEEDGGTDREGAGDLDKPLVDVGEGGRELLHRPRVADEREQRLDRLDRLERGTRVGRRAPGREGAADRAEAPPPEGDLEVLPHRQVLEELGGLVGAGDAGARDGLGGEARHLPLAEPHRARLRAEVAADQVEDGGLPGAVRADDARDRARLGAERDPVHRDHPAEGDLEPVDGEGLAGAGPGEERADVERPRPGRARVDAPEPALDLAHHPAGGRDEDDEEQHPDEEEPVLGEGGEELGEQHHDEGADDGPEDGSDPADDGDEEEEDRLEERERLGADELRQGGEDRPRDPRDRGRQRERGGSDHDRIEPERPGRELRIAHRSHGLAPVARVEACEEGHGSEREDRDEERHIAFDERVAEGLGEGDEHDPVPAAGHLLPLRRALLDHEAERDGDHREIGAAHPEGGDREQHPGDAGHDSREGKGGPEAPFVGRGEDRAHVGPDRVEARVPEGDLAGEAEEDVDPDPHHRGEPDEGDDVHLVAVCGDDGGRDENRDGEHSDPPGELHTFFTSARPKSPCGRAARATMTRAKVTMWVYVEPRREVMRASARP